MTFDENSNGREICLTSGDEFEIKLAENPTTGFRWHFADDGSPVVACIGDEFRAANPARPGEPGLHVWNIRCAAAGQAQIRLVHTRAGATNETTGSSFTLRLHSP